MDFSFYSSDGCQGDTDIDTLATSFLGICMDRTLSPEQLNNLISQYPKYVKNQS